MCVSTTLLLKKSGRHRIARVVENLHMADLSEKSGGAGRRSLFIDCLAQILHEPLPGREAHQIMAPLPRPGWEADFQPPAPPRQGGVLVLFYPHLQELHLPLILRPTYDGVHSGQVGFPGGGQDTLDPDLTATALREAYEEIGVEPSSVQILGQLSKLYIAPSNYEVTPTVGWVPERPHFRTDPYEVAQLLEAPLSALLDPANRHEEEWQLRDRKARVPFFSVCEQTIWGATAMILSELLALVNYCQNERMPKRT
jgi:8-oxo-dGTP pyrophosphatase MutT (NUDIX family)